MESEKKLMEQWVERVTWTMLVQYLPRKVDKVPALK